MAGLVSSAMGQQTQDKNVEDAMSNAPMPNEGMSEKQEPMTDEGEEAASDDPNYIQALAFAMDVLYEKEAAKNVAKSLRGAQDPVESLANTAYEITAIVDERTEGRVPDEYFALLATKILEEVADIAEAAGVQIRPADVALALKQMILRYLGEQGVDTTQLQQAMDQVNPEEFDAMAMEEGAA
jgi:hypothetical protein